MSSIETDRGTIKGHYTEVLVEAQREILRLVSERNLWRASSEERGRLLRRCASAIQHMAVAADKRGEDASNAMDWVKRVDDLLSSCPSGDVGRDVHRLLMNERMLGHAGNS